MCHDDVMNNDLYCLSTYFNPQTFMLRSIIPIKLSQDDVKINLFWHITLLELRLPTKGMNYLTLPIMSLFHFSTGYC